MHQRGSDGYWEWDPEDNGIYVRPAEAYVRPPKALMVFGADRRLAMGSGYHQDALRGRRVGSRVLVELVPEPGNPYDKFAVGMEVDGLRVGYLSAGEAERRQSAILKANELGYHVLAEGKVERVLGEKTVRISLPHPDDLVLWLARPAELRMSGYEQPIRLTLRGIQYYQAALKEIIGDRQRCVEPVTLRPEAEQSGKYVGRYRAQVSAGGLIIGVIPAADCADDKGMQRAFARGLAAGFVTLVRYPERIWGTVTLG